MSYYYRVAAKRHGKTARSNIVPIVVEAESDLVTCLNKPNVQIMPDSQHIQHVYGDNQLFDARTQNSIAYPPGGSSTWTMRLGGTSSGVAPNPCFLGGKVVGQQDRALTWEDVKALGGGSLFLEQPGGAIINGFRADNVEDGIGLFSTDFTNPNASDGWLIKNSYMVYIRDDCLSNDELLGGTIYDCLWEGYVGIAVSWDHGDPITDKSSKTIVVDHLLFHSKEQPHAANPPTDTGHVFKPSSDQTKEPAFVIRDSVFLLDDPGGAGEWPPNTTLTNVTIVRPGAGTLSLNTLPGMTVTTDIAVWDDAVADWKTRHGYVSFDTFTKLLNPDPPT